MSSPRVNAATLDAARALDPDAVSSIYRAYAPDLYRYFRTELRDKESAEDLVAGVFVSVIESLPGFRGPVEALGGWLFQIARYDLFDHRRQAARHPTESLEARLDEAAEAAHSPDPQELAVIRLEGGRLFAAVWDLPAAQRDVLLLRMAAGMSTPEVAAVLGRTVGAVKALQHRGLANLAGLIEAGEVVNATRTGSRSPGAARHKRKERTRAR
jgi:RNA polymerase sigma-70 factor (ECF subfamily)